jgi:2,3-bisphosphoglycerate-independent phosphoglycerate mutase
MSKVILLFIDGVGIGKKDFQFNPFFKYGSRFFEQIFGVIPYDEEKTVVGDMAYVFPSDPLMGIPGLPQSGTGQTSIFCGFNAPALINMHFGPYPYSTLIPEIKEKNIFLDCIKRNKKVSFLNAYPSIFFEYLQEGKQRLSVTTLSCRLAGVTLNSVEDIRAGKALTAEITNERWNVKLGYSLEAISPEHAASILLKNAEENDLTVYEYFLTDHLGHGRFKEETEHAYDNLDRFLLTLFVTLDKEKFTVIICSDHGNFEDLSVKTHTYNPALTVSYGKYANRFYESVKDLSNIKHVVLEILEKQ